MVAVAADLRPAAFDALKALASQLIVLHPWWLTGPWPTACAAAIRNWWTGCTTAAGWPRVRWHRHCGRARFRSPLRVMAIALAVLLALHVEHRKRPVVAASVALLLWGGLRSGVLDR